MDKNARQTTLTWQNAALLATGMYVFVCSVNLPGLLQPIATDFGISIAAAGQVVTVFSLTYAVSAPLLASATHGFERRRLLIGLLVCYAISNIAVACATNFASLLLARMCAAAFDGLYAATAVSIAATLAPVGMRGRTLAIVNSGVTFAFVVGVPISTAVALHFGWRYAFIVFAWLSVLSAFGLYRSLPQAPPPDGARLTLRERWTVLSSPQLAMTFATAALSYVGLFAVYTYLAPLASETGALSQGGLPLLLLIFGISAVAGNAVGGLASDRWGPRPTVIISLVAVAGLLILLPWLSVTFVGLGCFLFAIGFAHYTALAPIQFRAAALAPQHAAIAAALVSASVYLGVATGAAVGGITISYFQMVTLGPTGALFKLLALVVWISSFRAPRLSTADTVFHQNPR